MGDYKASGLVLIRAEIDRRGHDGLLREALDPPLYAELRRLVATQWVPIETASAMYRACSEVLFGRTPSALYETGHFAALQQMRGIYRALLSIVSPTFAMSQAGKLWSTFHRQGRAWAEKRAPLPDGQTAVLIVADYAELPEDFREQLRGWIAGLLEVTGVRDIKVQRATLSNGQWVFQGYWRD